MAGSIRQRGERSWELRVYAGRDPESGRKQYVTRTVKGSKREADRALSRLVGQVDDYVSLAFTRLRERCGLDHPRHLRPLRSRGR
ncbi:MAG: hypothetical protein OEU32_08075 [Acidimicrobiia bacterium]|nr:hypothetical protein [Acidimicrobiia bacterium]